ncbi:MAG: hypothetical protein KC561_05520 [Myxococcales bacterium]|nr:hypothetical protein [Myxococcales bacterium]
MAKLTPMQEVKERFGSKEALAEALIPMLERNDSEDADEFRARIAAASNKQLLRLHSVHETINRRFGSKEKLVDAIVAKKFPKGNDPYRAKLLTKRPAQLLDLVQSL